MTHKKKNKLLCEYFCLVPIKYGENNVEDKRDQKALEAVVSDNVVA